LPKKGGHLVLNTAKGEEIISLASETEKKRKVLHNVLKLLAIHFSSQGEIPHGRIKASPLICVVCVYFAGAGKLRQKLRQTKLFHISMNIWYQMEKLSCFLLIYYYLYVVLLYITMLFTINSVVKRCLKKIDSEITLKYFHLLPLLINMKFP
jgi:hypothetical protein